MFRSRKMSLVVLAALLLVAGSIVAPSHATADDSSGVVQMERVSLYYSYMGAWILRNVYVVTFVGGDIVDDDGLLTDYHDLTQKGLQVSLQVD